MESWDRGLNEDVACKGLVYEVLDWWEYQKPPCADLVFARMVVLSKLTTTDTPGF
jgi:hypothetical protein